MNIKSIYVNLPVQDLDKTRAFWTGLGFAINEDFSNDQAICVVMNEGTIYTMFLKDEFFAPFTDRPIADSSTTQVLLAIEVESREKLQDMVKTALANGAVTYKDPEDHGWMYIERFADPDGHQWELVFTDQAALEQMQKETAAQ